jgi:uncharacterized membrane protein YkvA (DUF1232 family)
MNGNGRKDGAMRKKDESWIERLLAGFRHVTGEKDVHRVVRDGANRMNELGNDVPSGLLAVWEELKLMLALLTDYCKGDYRDVSWQSLCAAAFAMAYFVMPLDAIPDIVPLVGYLDDAAVIGYVLKKLHDELALYRVWRHDKDMTIDITEN